MHTLIRHFPALLLATGLSLHSGPAPAAGPTHGEHGMALFGGKDGLYASHLPMFHAPHDYQVVLRLHAADPALDAALKSRLDGKTALWTVAPEKFELDRLAPGARDPLRRFKADLVLGHFEQGGKTQYGGATLVVDQVLLFRQLSPAAKVDSHATYVQVGNGQQRFLIKEIDSRPDFDHIVSYRAAASASTAPVRVAKNGMAEPDAAALAAALNALPSALRGTVYFYTDDLR
ncbi:hypothetical protein [Pseudoduganella namucuonensis]|uniref:Uncharacterized protein n=1 Tax=Pseudoduganella namucuonensis TaxID=1035707 RepID=A0A1I7EU08_9BURK|nr:hypothetical protein [Pseudoduganella namucuonensis]SFU27393.1 hypothetical protein SAMN05216552_100170 [Pseudoduganella namucuonensis]